MPWKLLFFGRVYENGYDVSSPYIYQGNLSDSINLGPKAGAYLLQKGMDQVIIATVEREPGPWNLLITGTTYLLVHWTIFCLVFSNLIWTEMVVEFDWITNGRWKINYYHERD